MHTTINWFAVAAGFYTLVVSGSGCACEGSCDKAPTTDNKAGVVCSTSDCGKCKTTPDAKEPGAKDAKETGLACPVFDDTLLFDIDKFAGYDRKATGARCRQGIGDERCQGK